MTTETRTVAGEVLLRLVYAADDRNTDFPTVPNSFIEGERDTASVWVAHDGKHFQVHVTELHPTEQDLDFYRGGNQ